jgi:glycosyltransferase involved in cell wall biosynthesis
MRLLILYEELAWYFVNCLNFLAQQRDIKIIVYSKQINAVAPFKFDYVHPNITIYYREDYTEKVLLKNCKSFYPQMVYLAGWAYKPYIHVIKSLPTSNTVIGFDNQYAGTLRQQLGILYFRLKLKPYIKTAFVPGLQQHAFAKKLGFKEEHIAQGAYCCDSELFADYHSENKTLKEHSFPKRFLFIGRYASEKGITLLWESFLELQVETPNEWELWCVGKGDIEPIIHPKIRHFGFLQPFELKQIISNTGVFVLPSTFEPWGVVIHECATAGFPLLSTNKVGAVSVFLIDGENGFIVKANDKPALKLQLKKFMSLSNKDLNLMAEKSVEISTKITPSKWVDSLMKLYEFK